MKGPKLLNRWWCVFSNAVDISICPRHSNTSKRAGETTRLPQLVLRMLLLLEKAEAGVRTDDEWTLVQCKYKSSKVEGTGDKLPFDHHHDTNEVRERNRFTMVNEVAKYNTYDRTTLKESDHEHEWNQDHGSMRESITTIPTSNG